jgi:hypothetical protein
MKKSLSVLLVGLMTASSLVLTSCCQPKQGHDHSHEAGKHSKMHHEHGDK